MFEFKTQEFKACKEYEVISKLKASIRHSSIYEGLSYSDREKAVESLNVLSSFLFDKIES